MRPIAHIPCARRCDFAISALESMMYWSCHLLNFTHFQPMMGRKKSLTKSPLKKKSYKIRHKNLRMVEMVSNIFLTGLKVVFNIFWQGWPRLKSTFESMGGPKKASAARSLFTKTTTVQQVCYFWRRPALVMKFSSDQITLSTLLGL